MRAGAVVAQVRSAAASSHASLVVVRLTTVSLTLLTLRFLAHRMGAADYSVYIIVIQLIAWPASIGLLGMGISLPRTIAAHSPRWSAESVLASAACLAAVTLLLPLALIAFASPEVSAFVLKDGHWAQAVAMGALYLATLAPLQLLLYYLVGLKRFRVFVATELIQSGVVPASIAGLDPAAVHVESFLLHYSILNLGLLVAALGFVANSRTRAGVAKLDFAPKWDAVKELLNVGTPKLISGLFFTLTVSSFPVALRWSGAGLEQTAAASLGLAIAITLARLAITSNALVGFMELASEATANRRKGLVAPVRQMLTFALAGGFTFAVFSAVAIDLAVRVLIGPAYEHQHLFLVLGAMFGSLQLVGYVVEIPMDAFAPAWRKAAASLIFAVVLATVIALGIATGILDAVGVVVAYWSIFAAFCVVLYLLVQRVFAEPIRPNPVLLAYLGCCLAVAIGLVVTRATLPNLLVQAVASGVAVTLIVALMAFFGLFRVSSARGAPIGALGE